MCSDRESERSSNPVSWKHGARGPPARRAVIRLPEGDGGSAEAQTRQYGLPDQERDGASRPRRHGDAQGCVTHRVPARSPG